MKQGLKKILILIRTADTDVVVLAVSVVEEIRWKSCGSHLGWKNIRYIAANAIAPSLDADKSRALPAFHAVTGCDTVSFFSWKGNLKA